MNNHYLVCFEQSDYSVPARWVGTRVSVDAGDSVIVIRAHDDLHKTEALRLFGTDRDRLRGHFRPAADQRAGIHESGAPEDDA